MDETSSMHQESTELCHFLFCYDSNHFAAFHPQNNNLKLKERREEAGEKGTELTGKVETP